MKTSLGIPSSACGEAAVLLVVGFFFRLQKQMFCEQLNCAVLLVFHFCERLNCSVLLISYFCHIIS
jgi:hypothetical protein